MTIKRFMCDNIDELLDTLLRTLIDKNISYVVINNGLFVEIHFDEYIYQLYDFRIIRKLISKNDLIDFIKTVGLNELEPCDIYDIYNKKEKTGYKRYTKKDIKRGNVKLLKNNNYKKR